MQRITEIAGIVLSFDPKPIQGDWNGAGAHTNYSTKSMGEDGGYEVIKKAIEKLGLKHKEHIAAYGEGNERRLTGRHETADINTFLWSRHRESWQREPSVWTDVLQEAEKNVLKSTKAVNGNQLLVSYLSDCKYVLQLRDLETEYLHFWNLTARHRCNLATEVPEMKIFCEIVISGFDRTEFQVNQIYSSPNEPYMLFKDTCNSSQTVVPTIAPAVVGDRRISLGPGAGCVGLATHLELGYHQACLAASRPELPVEVVGPATHNSNGEC